MEVAGIEPASKTLLKQSRSQAYLALLVLATCLQVSVTLTTRATSSVPYVVPEIHLLLAG